MKWFLWTDLRLRYYDWEQEQVWFDCPFQQPARSWVPREWMMVHAAYCNVHEARFVHTLFCPVCDQVARIVSPAGDNGMDEVKYWKAVERWLDVNTNNYTPAESIKAYNNGCPFDLLPWSKELAAAVSDHRALGKQTTKRTKKAVYAQENQ